MRVVKTTYNVIAGQSVERLAALSDGIFPVAMTLLVLDLHAPVSGAVRSVARTHCPFAPLAHVHDEFLDAGNFLGEPANTAQSLGSQTNRGNIDG